MGILVLDSSALLAVLLHEPEAEVMIEAMGKAEQLLLSAVTYMETGVVWDNRVAAATDPGDLDHLIGLIGAAVVPVTLPMAQMAREAYGRFGKGNHPARLNLGDCFAYALAKTCDAPLLFKGTDFDKTDIVSAVP